VLSRLHTAYDCLLLLLLYHRGEYKAGIGPEASCTRCSVRGMSTVAEASTSAANCTRIVPGFYASSVEGGVVLATKPCPQVGGTFHARLAWIQKGPGQTLSGRVNKCSFLYKD
jgi:hypothetical protein